MTKPLKIVVRGINGEYILVDASTGKEIDRTPTEGSTRVTRPAVKKESATWKPVKAKTRDVLAQMPKGDDTPSAADVTAAAIDGTMAGTLMLGWPWNMAGNTYFGLKAAKHASEGLYLLAGLEALPEVHAAGSGLWNMADNSNWLNSLRLFNAVDLGTPNINIPLNVGWAPKQTMNVSHTSNDADGLSLFFPKRWDVINEDANPFGVWYLGKWGVPRTDVTNPGKGAKAEKARQLFANRPYKYEGTLELNKPLQTVGDVSNRSDLGWYAENAGADGVIYNNVYDNGFNNNQVIFSFKQHSPTELLAPNGKVSNLTPEQYRAVRTPEFKRWFGDWENDPANASKVLDENGEPRVLYHGTEGDFNTFDLNFFGKTDLGDRGKGFYFAPKLSTAEIYGDKVMPVFLNIKNPYNGVYERYLNRMPESEVKDMLLKERDFQIKHSVQSINRSLALFEKDFPLEQIASDKSFKSLDMERAGVEYTDDLETMISKFTKAYDKQHPNQLLEVNELVGNFADADGYMSNYEHTVYNPNQIKSATNNNGNFSLDSNNIYENVAAANTSPIDFVNNMDQRGLLFSTSAPNSSIRSVITPNTTGFPITWTPESKVGLYLQWMSDRFGVHPLTSVRAESPIHFKKDVTGSFNANTNKARINIAADDPESVIIHEAGSHATDAEIADKVEPKLFTRALFDDNINVDVPNKVHYNNIALMALANPEGPEAAQLWKEARATIQEIRPKYVEEAKRLGVDYDEYIRNLPVERLLEDMSNVNGYGASYVTGVANLMEMAQSQPALAETLTNSVSKFIANAKTALTYLPMVTAPVILNNKK